MNKKKMMRPIAMAACMLALVEAHAQTSVLGNTPTSPGTDYVGWDNSTTVPLMIRHDANQPIEWYTNAIRRMMLNPTNTTATINGYNNQDVSGNLGIGDFSLLTPPLPFSKLHLDDGAIEEAGYRRWMRTGVTMTRESDLAYFGLKSEFNDLVHKVITWGGNVSGFNGPDRMKFIFTGVRNTTSISGSDEGLEAVRMTPSADGNQVLVGVGDWMTTGANADPSERLDLLNGRLRIRVLPDPSGEATGAYKLMVVDDTSAPSGERGVVKWVDPATLGAADCDWVEQNPEPHVSSVYDGSNCSWDRRHGVGIGRDVPRAKLHVHHNNYELLSRIGTWSRIESDDFQNEFLGVLGESGPLVQDGFAGHATGGRGLAYNCKTTVGVHGHGRFDSQQLGTGSGFLVGVHGVSEYTQPWQASFSAGVFGRAIAPQGAAQAWAGWFQGDLAATGDVWGQSWNTWSDESLKTNIADMEGALGRVLQLQPKTYQYNAASAPVLELGEAPQIGLLAQEVEAVVPEVVSEMTVPAHMNDDGSFSEEALTVKGVNYVALVPLLIGAIKEQQAQISIMQEQLAACCAAPPTDTDQRSGSVPADEKLTPSQERLLRIAPNPFTDRTTLYCTLERAGRMQLMANSSDGRDLRMLSEGQREAGEFQYEWSTEHLAPGVYYVTLLLDGEPVVKRAVKVGR